MQARTGQKRGERGVAIVIALFFALVVFTLASSMLLSGKAMANQQRAVLASDQAHSAAVSGVNYVIGVVDRSDPGLLLKGVSYQQTLKGAGGRAAQFSVLVTPGGMDALDNDLDGLVDEEDEWDVLEVTSTGSFDGIRKTVQASLTPRYRVPLMPGAVYLGNPLATVQMTSNAITIDGTDHNMDLSDAGTSMGVALGVGGDPTYIESQLEARNLNKMTGDPKVGQVATYDLDAMITQGAQAATIRLQDGSTSKPENPGDWGTADAPAILYGSGDISIASGTSGVGILIVDGNLRTTGGFEWRGLIIVRGGVYLGGGGNKNRVVGSVIVQNALSDEGSASLTNSGSSDLIYSREALRLVRTKFASAYLVTNWREAPTRGEVVLP